MNQSMIQSNAITMANHHSDHITQQAASANSAIANTQQPLANNNIASSHIEGNQHTIAQRSTPSQQAHLPQFPSQIEMQSGITGQSNHRIGRYSLLTRICSCRHINFLCQHRV